MIKYECEHCGEGFEEFSAVCPNCSKCGTLHSEPVTIREQAAEIERLREALMPFAAHGVILRGQRVSNESVIAELFNSKLTVSDFRKAANATVVED